MSDAAFATTPYKGLMPYSEEDAPFFFGRDEEREIIIANLMTSRLTLFYGPSGVGKSSVLRAGVAHQLRRLARENLDETGSPQFAIVVFNSWRYDPITALEARIRESAMQSLDGQRVPPVPSSRSLSEICKAWTERLGGELFIILDQFEEYFLYHKQAEGPDTFAGQFPRIVNSSDLSVNFLISIRDDGLAKLDRFQGKIPTLFENRLGIDHLDRSAARNAVTQPIDQFNRLYAAGRRRVNIELNLVEAVLDQVRAGEVTVGEAGRGVIKGEDSEARIETPYLQLVMTRLWNEDVRSGNNYTLRLRTLEALGGAKRIVRTHLDAAMNALPESDQSIAARVFHYLVTPSGTKIAHTSPDLAMYSELPQEKVAPVLERLSGADLRILRGVAPPPDKDDEPRYEIFHDVLGAAILDWRRRHAEANKRRRQEAEQKKRIVRFRAGVIALFVLVVAVVVFVATGKIEELANKTKTQEGEIAKAKERAHLDELALHYKDQPRYEKPIALLIGLTSDNSDDRSQALDNLKQLASNGQLPEDLVPVVIDTVKTNEPSKAEETRRQLQQAIKALPPAIPVSEKQILRVFIHIRDDQPQQREKAVMAKRRLEEMGLIVPSIERVSTGPSNNELRYFRNDEAGEAAEIIGYLKDLNFGNTQARYIRGFENSTIVRPHQHELWFGAPKKEPSDSGQAQQSESQSPPKTAEMQVLVKDAQTQRPLGGATVHVKTDDNSFAMTVITNAAGLAAFKDVPRGRALVRVFRSGFENYGKEHLIGGSHDPAKLSSVTRVEVALKRGASSSKQ